MEIRYLEKRVDEIVGKLVGHNTPGLSVLIGRDNEVLLRKAYGMANVAKNEALTPDHRFIIASVTKQFIGMAIMILNHAGRLSYDEPIARFFSDFPAWKDAVTIRHLVHHTSGVQEYLTEEFWQEMIEGGNFTQDMLLARIATFTELEFQPEERWRYCNSAYVMLGHIIEQAAGQSLASFIDEKIFRPLGMTRSVVGETGNPLPLQATGYEFRSKDEFTEAPYTREVVGWADGNIISTVDDLFLWGQALYTDKLLPLGALAEAFVPWNPYDASQTRYGFGHMISERRGLREVHHGGSTLGYNSSFSRFTDEKLTVIILSNAAGVGVEKIHGAIAEELLGDKMVPIKEAKLPVAHLEEKCGIYKGVPRGVQLTLHIELQESQLVASLRAGGREMNAGVLTPVNRNTFYLSPATNQFIEFRAAEGHVAHACIRTNGGAMNLFKETSG